VDLVHVAALIVVLLLAVYVVDAIRRPGRSNRPLARPDGEPFHAFTREPARRQAAVAGCHTPEKPRHERASPDDDTPPLAMVRILNGAYAMARRRSQ
jgi:hypothetical protein